MTILFRADGNAEIGAGHIMRCLSLAQALRDQGGNAVFLCRDLASAYAARLKMEGCTVTALKSAAYGEDDAKETLITAKEDHAGWIVLDGYHFTPEYQKLLQGGDVRVLVIDDHRYSDAHACDILLNQNPQCGKTYTHVDAKTLLLGTRYVMLRREYRNRKFSVRDSSDDTKRILITLGGSDPQNLTPFVVRALQNVSVPLKATVIVGGTNPHAAKIKKIAKTSSFPVEVLENVADMPAAIDESDIAISAAGSTCYELAFMSVPTLTVVVAENHNQDNVAEGLESLGATMHLGQWNSIDEKRIAASVEEILRDADALRKMSACARTVVDGEGVARVLMHMMGHRLRLRNAREEDCKMIWEWANDPETRKASFSSEKIPWEEHVAWFHRKLNDKDHYFFVAFNESDEPVGQVRFECAAGGAIISASIAPSMRGKKYGVDMITLGCRRLFASNNTIEIVDAYIKPDNEASIAVFTKTGFKALEPTIVKKQASLHFILKKDTLTI